MNEPRLTEKHLHDKRFRATETKILLTLSSVKDTLSPSRLAKNIGVARSTFYRHHRTVYGVTSDYEQYLLRKYRSSISRFIKSDHFQFRNLYERTFIFLFNYRQIINFLFSHGKGNFIEKLIQTLEPKIISTGKITSSAMFAIYAKEVTAIVEQWTKGGYSKSAISAHVDKIVYLTNTARIRLGPITASPTKSSGQKSPSVV